MLRLTLAIARKDLFLALARGGWLCQAVLLGLVLIFVFSLARGAGEPVSAQAAATVFWVCSMFCQVLVFNQLYAQEEANGAKLGLLLAGQPVQGVWLGKCIAGLLLLLLAQAVFFPAAIIFLDQEIRGDATAAFLALLLADIGLAAIGSLLGAAAQGQSTRESLLGILLFPLLIPLLLGGIRSFTQAMELPQGDDGQIWLYLAMAFDAVYLGAGLFLFGFVYTGED